MLTRSLPFLPIISPRLMYLLRLLFTLPRTSLRKRCSSRSIFCPTTVPPGERGGWRVARGGKPLFSRHPPPVTRHPLFFGVSAGEDAGHVGQHVRRARLVVA